MKQVKHKTNGCRNFLPQRMWKDPNSAEWNVSESSSNWRRIDACRESENSRIEKVYAKTNGVIEEEKINERERWMRRKEGSKKRRDQAMVAREGKTKNQKLGQEAMKAYRKITKEP